MTASSSRRRSGEADYLPSGLYAVSVPTEGMQIQGGEILLLPLGVTALRYPALAADGRIAVSAASLRAWRVGAGRNGMDDGPAHPRRRRTRRSLTTPACCSSTSSGRATSARTAFRYVNPSNVVISGDATYAGRNGVAEWTDLSLAQDGSLLVGYAVWTLACIVRDGTHHRLLEAGDAKRLKAHRSGDVLTMAITKHDGAALITMLVSDVPTLPVSLSRRPRFPPILHGEFMIDPKTLIPYKGTVPSSRAGCVNFILHDGSVFSCQADGSPGTRPAGTDGPWEQGQQTGSLATFNSNGSYYAFGCARRSIRCCERRSPALRGRAHAAP